ncbi:MAG: aldo/keto reductase [Candidatus Hydrothermota bacterium]|nr:MAG: aldo/keto reductase [Candidatus Hydrothermae bacterium]
MKYKKFGNTGLEVSVICLGTMQFGWSTDEKTSFKILDKFFEEGGNFIDTADVYSRWVEGNPGGVSERIIGKWMKSRNVREGIVLATKVRGRMWEGPNGEGLSRKHIMKAVEDSLRRLQTDYIDLYQVHWPDWDTPLEETLRALDDLVRDGKVRYIGVSNYPAWYLTKALWISDKYGLHRFESIQPQYSLVYREEFEKELMPLAEDQKLAVIPYSPLAGGFLTGKYKRNRPLPPSPRAETIKRRFFTEKNFTIIEELEKMAFKYAAKVSQIALAWLLSKSYITAPIIGASSVEQLMENLGALDVELEEEDLKKLDEISSWRQ